MPHREFLTFIKHYIAPNPNRELREMFLAKAILTFAVSMVTIFEPIYLYRLGFSLSSVVLVYAAMYVLYLLLVPIGGQICRRHGYEHTMFLSSPFLIIYYLSYLLVPQNHWFIILTVLALAIHKILYWPGYHANFATWSRKVEEGREVSNMYAVMGAMGALAPVVGGLLILVGGFPLIFVATAALILLSNVPLLRTPEVFMPRSFSYLKAWKRLFEKKRRRQLFGFFGFGENFILAVAWPLYVAIVIPSAIVIGMVISLARLFDILFLLYVGKVTDDEQDNKDSVLRSGVIYSVLAWLVRPFLGGSLGVFLSDTFGSLSMSAVRVPLVSIMYESARQDDDPMETIVFAEMALSIAKVVAGLACAVILHFWVGAWWVIFFLAALFTLLYSFIGRRSGGLPEAAAFGNGVK